MTKHLLVLLLFALPVFAQDQAAKARAAAGCGPNEVQFDVKTNKNQHPTADTNAEKAVVYVFEEEKRDPGLSLGSLTTRVGLDGAWIGANHGKSYFYFLTKPGEHRLCTNWQSSFEMYSKLGAAANLSAEAGKVYYYRTRVYSLKERQPAVTLEPIDSAEGQLLISVSAFSASHPKGSVVASKK